MFLVEVEARGGLPSRCVVSGTGHRKLRLYFYFTLSLPTRDDDELKKHNPGDYELDNKPAGCVRGQVLNLRQIRSAFFFCFHNAP